MKKIFFALSVLAAMSAVSCVKDEQNPDALVPEEKPVKYTDLVLNEINGNGSNSEKYIEIFNKGTEAISLLDVKITYNGNDTWSGAASDVIQPSGYFVVLGTKKAETPGSMMSTGLSAGKYIAVELFDPKGNSLDLFQRGDGSGENVADGEIEDMDYSRMPDGTGNWYYTDAAGTKGATNGTSTDGLTAVGDEPLVAKVVLNELNGTDEGKFIELYNAGNAPAPLAGWKMYKDGKGEENWTGTEGLTLAAGEYLVLWSEDVAEAHPEVDGSLIFASGLSAKKTVKIELKDAAGETMDVFMRGSADGEWNVNIQNGEVSCSFARVPNGTGDFALANATPGEDNGEDSLGEITY